jgi:hypothetical protein
MKPHYTKHHNWRYSILSGFVISISTLSSSGFAASKVDCDVAIIGGGPGGVHTAFRLVQNPPAGVDKTKVCLFEKKDKLGGRLEDKPVGLGGALTGTGAYRMYPSHYPYQLMQELGLASNDIDDPDDNIETQNPTALLLGINHSPYTAGNLFGVGTSFFTSTYGVSLADDFDAWQQLMCGPQVPRDGDKNPIYEGITGIGNQSAKDYAISVLGQNGFDYLADTYTFKSDFQAPYIDAVEYMEYNANDWAGAVPVVYAIPGFSVLINKMKSDILAGGGKIFLNSEVTTITSKDGNYNVIIKSQSKPVIAKNVIIATDLLSLKNMTGNIVTAITKQEPFIKAEAGGAYAVTITNQWTTKWWNSIPASGDPILRGGLTGITTPHGYCLTRFELPNTAYHDSINVTRSVYVDDRACAMKWNKLYTDTYKAALSKKGGNVTSARIAANNAVNDEIYAGFHILFPDIFVTANRLDTNNPQIANSVDATAITVHPFAWNGLGQGAFKGVGNPKNVTLQSLWDWSVQPLANERVYLVGDGYVMSNGWSASAYMSSVRVLNEKFGMNVPTHDPSNSVYPTYPRIKCDDDNTIIFP